MSLVGLISCKDVEGTEEESREEVALRFTVDMADKTAGTKVSRAAGDGELTTALLQEVGFGVYCWYTGSTSIVFTGSTAAEPAAHISTYTVYELMRNQKVTYDTDRAAWEYTPTKYWPLADHDKLTLRAYAPYTGYLVTDGKGMPQLPVVVAAGDYHNGTQHDPLWGTSRHGGSDDEGTTYGTLYNNYTFKNSGDYLDSNTPDSRDGTIDWYFHHGMAKLMFASSVTQDPGCDKVTITSITITPLYVQGLLGLNSATASSAEKPTWDDRAGDMTVVLGAGDLAASPMDITTFADKATDHITLLDKGLLIIPRNYTSTPMSVTITYTIDGEADPMTASATISRNFEGNTSYTLNMSLTPSTKGLEITLVQSAFTPWVEGGSGTHTVYNW